MDSSGRRPGLARWLMDSVTHFLAAMSRSNVAAGCSYRMLRDPKVRGDPETLGHCEAV